MIDATNETKGRDVTGTTDTKFTREWWEQRKGQIDRALKPIEQMDADELATYRRDLRAELAEAVVWRDRCHNALIQKLQEGANGKLVALDASPYRHPDGRDEQNWPLRRALAQAEEREVSIRRRLTQVNKQTRILRRRTAFEAINERDARVTAERRAKQAELDRQAVEAVKPARRTSGLVQWGKQLVRFES